ncbi:MAG TPA: hypothetical protein VGE07_02695 [Herpetosiphonaceae bacterium]
MTLALQIMLALLIGLCCWRATAYGIAWRRTGEEIFGVAAGSDILGALICLWSLPEPAARTSFLLIIIVAEFLIRGRLATAAQRSYRSHWDLLRLWQPRTTADS